MGSCGMGDKGQGVSGQKGMAKTRLCVVIPRDAVQWGSISNRPWGRVLRLFCLSMQGSVARASTAWHLAGEAGG